MPSIDITIDTLPPLPNSERRAFFTGKIVTITAYVGIDNGYIADGDTASFYSFNTGASMLPYDGFRRIDEDGAVIVDLKPTHEQGSKTGTATFRALVWTTFDNKIYAKSSRTGDLQSNPYFYRVSQPSATALAGQPTLLAIPTATEACATPASGNYAHYRFTVWDPDREVPLKDMCVRLSSREDAYNIHGYAFYERMTNDSTENLDAGNDKQYIDLVTDEHGMAEVFICGKFNPSASPDVPIRTIDTLTWRVGMSQESGYELPWLMLLNFSAMANVGLPRAPKDLSLSRVQSVSVGIPFYDGATGDDFVFLFCNGEFQGSQRVVPSGENQDVASIQVPTCGLRSTDYGDVDKNYLQYAIKRSVGDVVMSPRASFPATGVPPEVRPLPVGAGGGVPPPVPVSGGGFVAGWPINSRGSMLQLRIPLEDAALSDILVGDFFELKIYLNGFRAWMDGTDEPRGKVLQGPGDAKVTPMIKQGKQEMIFDFQADDLAGFGQKFTTGELGTLEAQYTVLRSAGDKRDNDAAIYRSEVMTLGLDTIAPAGAELREGDAEPLPPPDGPGAQSEGRRV
jgi:hypothetical protein